MENGDRATVITMRVSDSVPAPKELGETYVMTCDRCGESVYTTSTTYERLGSEEISQYEIVCNVCIVPDLEEAMDTDEEFIAADPELEDFAESHREELIQWMLGRAKKSS